MKCVCNGDSRRLQSRSHCAFTKKRHWTNCLPTELLKLLPWNETNWCMHWHTETLISSSWSRGHVWKRYFPALLTSCSFFIPGTERSENPQICDDRYIRCKGNIISDLLTCLIFWTRFREPPPKTAEDTQHYLGAPQYLRFLFIRPSNHVTWRLYQCFFSFRGHRPGWDPHL